MLKLLGIGLCLLLATTSCVAPPAAKSGQAAPAAARAALVQAPRVVTPAGPSLALLAAPPALAATQTTAIGEAPAFVAQGAIDDQSRALDCLTAAVYYEARSESVDGQRAVAQVVLNRVRNPAFPASVCGVVYEGSKRETGCQFTFTCDGSMLGRREPAAWERARAVAAAALGGDVYAPVGAATYYHTTAVSPWWASSLQRVTTIGAHIFYRWGGAWANALNFRQQYSGAEPEPSAGMTFAEKAADEVLGEIGVPSVTVHRGSQAVAVTAGTSTSNGVRVHRGDDTPGISAGDAPPTVESTDDKPV
jgi:spore germination cell wall hydrolase CwlJ-like protein